MPGGGRLRNLDLTGSATVFLISSRAETQRMYQQRGKIPERLKREKECDSRRLWTLFGRETYH